MTTYYFAGGGTGGHIFPALAIAERIIAKTPSSEIFFFCSDRPIDTRIFSKTRSNYIPLPAKPPGKSASAIFNFLKSYRLSKQLVKKTIAGKTDAVMVGIGGFVSAPALTAAHGRGIDVYMLNIDAAPGRANKFCARFAKKIFVQFAMTGKSFGKKTVVTGAPLRSAFFNTDRAGAILKLGLNPKKKTLLITGASGGAANINSVIAFLMDKLEFFSAAWQIVHLAGIPNYEMVRTMLKNVRINLKVLDFCDDMPSLLSAADLAIGRAGAMSIAEFAAANTPAICLPYPYHRDSHQHINAEQLEKHGCLRIVTDTCDTAKTARLLWPVLSEIMNSPEILEQMRANCRKFTRPEAAEIIAEEIMPPRR